MSEFIMREAEARAVLLRWNDRIRYLVLNDEAYQLLDDAQAARVAEAAHAETVSVLGAWSKERSDCAKFALLCMAVLQVSHARKSGPPAGLAFGLLHYTRAIDNERHVINVVLTRVAGHKQVNVRCFEPQTGEEVVLTPGEKKSITVIYM